MIRNRPSNVRQICFERMIEQAKNARTEFLREQFWLCWRSVGRRKMSTRSRLEGPGLPVGALLVVWLLFYGLLVVHGLTTSYTQRLARAWAVQDNVQGDPGEAKTVRQSLTLVTDKSAK
jgi:hypothetical protein